MRGEHERGYSPSRGGIPPLVRGFGGSLDLLLTNSPSPVNKVKGMPPIGKADQDIVYVENDIKAKRIQHAPGKIFLYKRADLDGLRDHLARFRDTFLSSDHSHMSVNDMWVSFKSEVITAIERFIPTKMTKTKYSLPWIDSSIQRLIRKRKKLVFRARKSSSPDVKNHYKQFRAHVQKVIRDAYWKHISNIFSFEMESPDPGSPRKNEKAKCICCKTLEHMIVSNINKHLTLEHIIVSNINKHLAFESILADCQHGFRSQRSCETQLVQFFHNLVSNLDRALNRNHRQTEVIIMDFAKAFDKVTHRRLLYKLDYYGIRGSTHKWITSWLSGRSQKVVLDGQASDPVPVLPGVPKDRF